MTVDLKDDKGSRGQKEIFLGKIVKGEKDSQMMDTMTRGSIW